MCASWRRRSAPRRGWSAPRAGPRVAARRRRRRWVRRVTGGRLVVCPTPIGNLEDVTLRVLAALREADVIACEDTRRTRMLLERYGVQARSSPTTSTTSASGRRSWSSACSAGETVALVSDAGMPLVSDPGLRARAGLRGGRARGRGAARDRRRRWPRWWPARCRPTPGASPASCRASARRWSRCSARPRRVVAFESPRRVGASLAVLAELDPDAPGRGLPRADQAPRGVRARARRGAGGALRRRARRAARSCSCSAGAPRMGADPAAIDAVRRLDRRGRARRGWPRASWPSSRARGPTSSTARSPSASPAGARRRAPSAARRASCRRRRARSGA